MPIANLMLMNDFGVFWSELNGFSFEKNLFFTHIILFREGLSKIWRSCSLKSLATKRQLSIGESDLTFSESLET